MNGADRRPGVTVSPDAWIALGGFLVTFIGGSYGIWRQIRSDKIAQSERATTAIDHAVHESTTPLQATIVRMQTVQDRLLARIDTLEDELRRPHD